MGELSNTMKLEQILNSKIVKLLFFFLLGVLSLLLQEGLARSSIGSALEWFWIHPLLALANLAIVLSIMAIFTALLGRVAPGVIVPFLLLLLVALVNHEKILRLHQPFFAWDLRYYEQIIALLPALSLGYIASSVVQPLGALFFVCVCALAGKEKSLGKGLRIGLCVTGALLLSIFVFHRELPRDLPSLLSSENATWDQRSNYYRNGFLLAFALNVQPLLIAEPQGYSRTAIDELLAEVLWQDYESDLQGIQQPVTLVTRQPVSLLLFVSESFYDLLHVRFEAAENPLQNFQELETRFPSFRMSSPTFGGNTSNVEFEMLTGLSNAFLPAGAVPYDHYLTRELPALPQILRGNGYRTIAVHPYYEWFWNRREAYPRLGFDEFLSLKDFDDTKRRGWFVSDEALVDKVVTVIDSTDAPFFVYALSMQNHGEYDPLRYAPDELAVTGEFTEKRRQALQTYVTGLRDADRQLARLLEYLESRPEPIVTLFCGDHLPSFGPDFAVYRESGTIGPAGDELSLEDWFKLSSVPCLLWANKEGLLNTAFIPPHISPVYFTPLLLKQLGVAIPKHLRYLFNGMDRYPVIHRQFLREPEGKLVDFLTSKDEQAFLRGLEMLQYDILFGNRHSLAEPEESKHRL